MFRIGEIARKSGFSPKTLRYYDEIGLLVPERRNPVTGFRHYGEDALVSLRIIRSSRRAGLRLRDIGMILRAVGRRERLHEAVAILDGRMEALGRYTKAVHHLRRELAALASKGGS